MPIDPLNLPDADVKEPDKPETAGDVEYYTPQDPIRWDVDNRPLRNLAYRDNMIANKVEEVIQQVNKNTADIGELPKDVSDLKKAVGNQGEEMPWNPDNVYAKNKASVATAINKIDAALRTGDPQPIKDLQTALGTKTAVFIGEEEGDPYVKNKDAKGAALALNAKLFEAVSYLSELIDKTVIALPVTWKEDTKWVGKKENQTDVLISAIEALDFALQEYKPETTKLLGAFDETYFVGEEETNYVDKTESAHEAVKKLDEQLKKASDNAAAALDLSDPRACSLPFTQERGQFHSIQIEIAQCSDPNFESCIRINTGPAVNYHYMEAVAAPKRYNPEDEGTLVYSWTVKDPLILLGSFGAEKHIGDSAVNYISLVWKDKDGKWRIISSNRGEEAEPGGKMIPFPNCKFLQDSEIDPVTGKVMVKFKPEYCPLFSEHETNNQTLLYFSYHSAPHVWYMYIEGRGGLQANAEDLGGVFLSNYEGKIHLDQFERCAMIKNHWFPGAYEQFDVEGGNYLTFLPRFLLEKTAATEDAIGWLKRGVPLLIRIRAIHESMFTGTCIAGPWTGGVLVL